MLIIAVLQLSFTANWLLVFMNIQARAEDQWRIQTLRDVTVSLGNLSYYFLCTEATQARLQIIEKYPQNLFISDLVLVQYKSAKSGSFLGDLPHRFPRLLG